MRDTLDEQKIKEVIDSLKTIENHLASHKKQASLLIIQKASQELNQLTFTAKERKKINRTEQFLGKLLHWLMKLE